MVSASRVKFHKYYFIYVECFKLINLHIYFICGTNNNESNSLFSSFRMKHNNRGLVSRPHEWSVLLVVHPVHNVDMTHRLISFPQLPETLTTNGNKLELQQPVNTSQNERRVRVISRPFLSEGSRTITLTTWQKKCQFLMYITPTLFYTAFHCVHIPSESP